jgi:hypothetical protein
MYIQDGSGSRSVNSGDQIGIKSFLLKLVYKQVILSVQCPLLLDTYVLHLQYNVYISFLLNGYVMIVADTVNT